MMDSLLDPRKAAGNTIVISLMLVALGAVLSMTRLEMSFKATGDGAIAASRAESCRVLPPNQTVELGAYYFQPTQSANGQTTGSYLPEGTYICDPYGNSARIERGGYAQFLINAPDAADINATLEKRLAEPANPDAVEGQRVQRSQQPVYVEPQQQETKSNLFSP